MAKINDFGEKIGGARKDVWKGRGLMVSDIYEMNEIEVKKHVNKDNIWPRPNWVDLVSNGTPQAVAYWQNEMRKRLPVRPISYKKEDIENYITVMGEIRDGIMAVKSLKDASDFYENFLLKNYVTRDNFGSLKVIQRATQFFDRKFLNVSRPDIYSIVDKAKKELFAIPEDKKVYTHTINNLEIIEYDGESVYLKDEERFKATVLTVKSYLGQHFYYIYENQQFFNKDEWKKGTFIILNQLKRKPLDININTREEAEKLIETLANKLQDEANKSRLSKNKGKSNRKTAFIPPQLEHIQRTGPEYRKGSVTGDMYLEDLKFRAGEYGNWMNENDRQTSLDMGYEALMDLARILKIQPEDISFDGKLAIAFGARGIGGLSPAAAHYEVERQVINLTKMSGAGCLAHEWAHGLDHAIGIDAGTTDLASRSTDKKLPESFEKLIHSLKYKEGITSEDEIRADLEKEKEHSKTQVKNRIKTIEPKNMSSAEEKQWNELIQSLLANVNSFTGGEYIKMGRFPVSTNPYVEALSAMRKSLTGHVIPKDTKRNISYWAKSFKISSAEDYDFTPQKKEVETDFYIQSGKFDDMFAKERHGYWQSDCEMFARAFDCYISDKLKEEGYKSDFLTSHADCFVVPGDNGSQIAAIPLGEERKIINKNFDLLINDLKDRGFFQEYIVQEHTEPVQEPEKHDFMPLSDFDWNIEEPVRKTRRKEVESNNTIRYKQMSFADLIENAAIRSGPVGRGTVASPNKDSHIRE